MAVAEAIEVDVHGVEDISGLLDDLAKLKEHLEKGLPAKVLNGHVSFPSSRVGTLLTEACHRMNKEAIRMIADVEGIYVNARDSNGFSPLHISAARNDADAVILLLCEPCLDVEPRTTLERAPVSCPEVGSLMRTAVSLNEQDETTATELKHKEEHTGLTPLHMAATFGCYRSLRALLSSDDIQLLSRGGPLGLSALHMAARGNHAACVVAILQDGRCGPEVVNALDSGNETPLMRAVRRAATLSVHALCRHPGIDLGVRSRHKGFTALHLATMARERADALRVMLCVPACKPSQTNDDGCTPLHAAVWNNNADAVKALLTRPATDVNYTNDIGWTPLTMGLRGLAQNLSEREGGKKVRPPCSSSGQSAAKVHGDVADQAADTVAVPWAGAMASDAIDDDSGTVASGASASTASSGSGLSYGTALRAAAAASTPSSSSLASSVAGRHSSALLGGSGKAGAFASAVAQARASAEQDVSDDLAELMNALRLLVSDMRVDLDKREVKPWTPFRKDAAAVAKKYKLAEAGKMLQRFKEMRGREDWVRGRVDPKLAAWFSARGFGCKAAVSVLACNVGVHRLKDMYPLAEILQEHPKVLEEEWHFSLIEKRAMRVELERLATEAKQRIEAGATFRERHHTDPSIVPECWHEAAAELEAELALAVERAEAPPSSQEASDAGGGQHDGGEGGEGDGEREGDAERKALAAAASSGEHGASKADDGTAARASSGTMHGGGEGKGHDDDDDDDDDGGSGSSSGIDLPLRSILIAHGVAAEAEAFLLSQTPPMCTRNAVAAMGDEAEAAFRAALPQGRKEAADGVIEACRRPTRHESGVAKPELTAFLASKGLDETTWIPVLTRLGARRPSHLVSVERAHLEGESIPPLQREAFFKVVGSLKPQEADPASSRGGGAGAEPSGTHHPPVAEPTTLIGFVNHWLSRLYADRPAIAITLVVVIILAIVGGVVTGSLAASDVVGGDGGSRLLRGTGSM